MRKRFTFLLRRCLLSLNTLLIFLCLLSGTTIFAQVIVIDPPPVFKATSTTTITSSVSPSISGQPVLLTATVTSIAQGFPSGTIHFINNNTNTDLTPDGVALTNGKATFTTPILATSTSFTATYSGDGSNLTSTSVAYAQTVNGIPIVVIQPAFYETSTTLVSNANPSVAGSQPVTFTATVGYSGDANLTGKVHFWDNTNNADLTPGGVALSNGVATFTTSSLPFGDLNITATYGGDTNGNQSSTSNSLIQHVLLNISGIGVTLTSSSSGNTSKWGERVTFTAMVSTSVGAAGTVLFTDNGYFLGSATIDGSGLAILKTSILGLGSHNINASYFSMTSNTLTQTVTNPYSPTNVSLGAPNSDYKEKILADNTSLIYQPNNSIGMSLGPNYRYGQPVTIVAFVSGGTGYTPTGTVTFFDGTTSLGTVALDAEGNAVFTTSILSVGTHQISMFYSGDAIYADQESYNFNNDGLAPSAFVGVDPATTTTVVSSSLNPSVTGQQQITFTAKVTPPSGFGNAIQPTGTVTFSIDGVVQGPVPLETQLGGLAFLSISSLSPGTHTIKASYSGVDNYYGSSFTGSEGTLKQTVTAVGDAILYFLGSSQSTPINTFFPNDLQFNIININPKLVGGAAITFTAPSSGPSGTFSNGTNTITVHTTALGSIGVADSGPFKANGIAGSYTVTATIPGMGTADFTLTNEGPSVQITVGTSMPGRSFTVDGTAFTNTQTFSWAPGSSHSLATTSPQAGATGTRYIFTGWSDGTNTLSNNITVPSTATSYTAGFNTQYQLTTAVNTSDGGTVSPASATFYIAGEVVSLTATPQAGYQFSGWTGNVASMNTASTSVTMSAPQSVTANFSQLPVTIPITVGTSVPGLSFTVDGTTYTSTQTLNWLPGTIHSVSTSTTQAGAAGSQYVFTSWSNGGDAGQFVSANASTTFTANFKTQYQLTTISAPAPGSSGSITQASGSFYDAGSVISVQASPAAGSCFAGFTGDLTGINNPQNLTMNGAKTVTAAFVVSFQYYVDSDKDGYGSTATEMLCSLSAPVGYSTNNTDCDDGNVNIHAAVQYYVDGDKDGYGSTTTAMLCALTAPLGYSINNSDCNDGNAAINPATIWILDADVDGYYKGNAATQCSSPGTGYIIKSNQQPGDCNDGNPSISPMAVEVCGNKVDDNCNSVVDEAVCYACVNGTNLKTTNITSTSAQISWSAIANPVQWQLRYKSTKLGSRWVEVLLTGDKRSYNLTSLSSNQNYQWQLRAKCGNIWTSYSNAIEFKTMALSPSSETITIKTKDAPITEAAIEMLKLHPNPTTGSFHLELKLRDVNNSKANIQLIDMLGRTVYAESTKINNGLLQERITIPSTAAHGTYLVMVAANNRIYKVQFNYRK